MSIRTLCIWIIVAGILGAGVIAVRARQAKTAAMVPVSTMRTFGFDPAHVDGLVRIVDGKREILERDPETPDQWVIHYTRGGLDRAWGVESIKARSGIRALATAQIQLSDVDLVSAEGGELEIRRGDGSWIWVVFDSESAGGFTGVRVEERGQDGIATKRWFGRVDRSIVETFVHNGMMKWRSRRLFNLSNSGVRSVELEAGGAKVVLARTRTGWVIEEPYAVHGDRETIEDLVKVLISLQANAFIDDDQDAATSGFETPIATVRMGAGESYVTLVIGSRADVGGSLVYAKILNADDTAVVTLESEQLAKLTSSAQAYMSKTPSPQGTASIETVRINGRDGVARLSATRSVGEWMIGDAKADSLNGEAIDRLVRVLTRDEAQIVQVFDANIDANILGTVELVGSDGVVLDRFDIAIDSTDTGMRSLIMRALDNDHQAVWVFETEDAVATGAWLTAVASKRRP